jgi:hypothetical protein
VNPRRAGFSPRPTAGPTGARQVVQIPLPKRVQISSPATRSNTVAAQRHPPTATPPPTHIHAGRPSFFTHAETYLAATANSAYLLLLNVDDDDRRQGVFNCWTLGRRDPRPLILLRRLLPSLSGRSLIDGIHVLAHVTPHPDILWTKQNWIPPLVEEPVQASFRWSPDELTKLVHAVETMDEGGGDWRRGGVGQSLWSIMVIDPDLCGKLPVAIRNAVDAGQIQAAVRLLVCYQCLADDPVADVDAIMRAHPALAENEMASWIVEELQERGRFDVY